jgi:hypothetical protein
MATGLQYQGGVEMLKMEQLFEFQENFKFGVGELGLSYEGFVCASILLLGCTDCEGFI